MFLFRFRCLDCSSEEEHPLDEDESDEYFTPLSTIISSDSGADCGAVSQCNSTKAIDVTSHDLHVKGQQKSKQTPNATIYNNRIDATNESNLIHNKHDIIDSGNNKLTVNSSRQMKCNEYVKQTSNQSINVLDTENRCNTIVSNKKHHPHSAQDHRAKTVEQTANNIKSHRRCCSARNSVENKGSLSRNTVTAAGAIASDKYSHSNGKRASCKRMPSINYSDSSDINSETNLVIENMRNRECQMYRKISFNNGYFSTTGSSSDYMYCTSDTNSIESTTALHTNTHKKTALKEKKCCGGGGEYMDSNDLVNNTKKSPKLMAKRKCRSFPLTENRCVQRNNVVSENVIETNKFKSNKSNSARRKSNNNINNADIETNSNATNTYQNSRKITITIKTKTIPNTSTSKCMNSQQPIVKQIHSMDKYLSNVCESSNESDTTVSDYATLKTFECETLNDNNNDEDDVDTKSMNSDNSDENSFFSIKSDNECVSETSQYFNCLSSNDLNARNSNFHAKSVDEMCQTDEIHEKFIEKMPTNGRNNVKHSENVIKRKTNSPMICIEQELSGNHVITSRVEVDKEKIREFKQRLKKRTQKQQIIDSSFSEEIFSETSNSNCQTNISCNKQIIDDIVASLESDQHMANTTSKTLKNAEHEKQKYISDGFMFEKLHASPKYTGKSISRLLAHRIEQHTITNVRRTLLRNVAYAINAKERQEKLEKKRLSELPPIKPPRSFTTSASSSPLSKQSFESSATIPIAELNKIEAAPMGFVVQSSTDDNSNHAQMRNINPQYSEATSVQFGWARPGSNIDNNDSPAPHYSTAEQTSNESTHYYSTLPNMKKEDIDTVDSSRKPSQNFQQFSAKLSENNITNYSTPIKSPIASNDNNNMKYACTMNGMPSNAAVKVCEKCHCVKDKTKHVLLNETGKSIGKAALKRTKTLIGTSKKFLRNSVARKSSKLKKSKQHDERQCVSDESFKTPIKDGDNTVCNNRDTISQESCSKRVDKSLNLTPKEFNRNIVELNPSPKRVAEISNMRLLRDAPSKQLENDDSEVYVTPDETFDFNRVVTAPSPQEKNKSVKRSPSKIISKLAKSSRKFFGFKNRSERRDSTDESTHYYKANEYDKVDNIVLLMSEMLLEMRKQIEESRASSSNDIHENIVERPPSAKKCLFRDRKYSTSSGDILDDDSIIEKITRIDLHDEPEPLYAEIKPHEHEQQQTNAIASNTLFRSCLEEDTTNGSDVCTNKASVELKEVYISDGNDSSLPSRYIMVNNNPKILYATVNRNSTHTKSMPNINDFLTTQRP